MTELCDIMKTCGSDKGDDWHNYTETYEKMFAGMRLDVATLFEVGIGTNNKKFASFMKPNYTPGGSLRGWRDYFPNATVRGADIDPDILFTEDRIETFQVDQTNQDSIEVMLTSMGDDQYDIIIDDGLHTLPAAVSLFKHVNHKLKEDGLYIIEDIQKKESSKYIEKFEALTDSVNMAFEYLELPHERNKTDNTIIVIYHTASTKSKNIVDSLKVK